MSPAIGTIRIAPRDLVAQAIDSLMAHRLRAVLSAVGIVVGIATVMTALAIGEGARDAALSEIGALGIDNVFVRAVAAPPPLDRRARPVAPVLSLADVRAIGDALPSARAIMAARVAPVEAIAGARRAQGSLAGVTVSWRTVADPQLAAGRWLTADDEQSQRRVAILGGQIARELFAGAVPAGSRVRAAGTSYAVVGVLRERSATDARAAIQSLDTDRALLVPIGTMDLSLGDGDSRDRVLEIGVRVGAAGDVETSQRAIAAMLSRRRVDKARYEIVVPRELLRARLRARRTFDALLGASGLLALLISGVGIMNIMLASVASRVQEIGVRRAFGARRAEITAQFAVEAAVLCVGGGLVGVPLGVALAFGVALAAGWPVATSAATIGLSLLLAAVTGALFGVYPARVAAQIQPVDALRSV